MKILNLSAKINRLYDVSGHRDGLEDGLLYLKLIKPSRSSCPSLSECLLTIDHIPVKRSLMLTNKTYSFCKDTSSGTRENNN